jgi:hypothetical protein
MAKYSKGASKKVEKVMHEMKKGKLKSGGSGKKVTSRKQAIAIGLSEARKAGAKVPSKKTAAKKTTAKKAVSKKTTARKSTAKKSALKKTAPKKSAAKKTMVKKAAKKSAPKKTASKKTSAKKATAKKTASKKTASKKTSAGKASAKKSAPKKTAVKKTTAKKSAPKKATKAITPVSSSVKNTASFPIEDFRQSPYTNIPEVNDAVHSEHRLPTDQSENTMDQREHLDFIPDKFKTSPQDPYHGHVDPSQTKSKIKPAGKKPLWNDNKK